MPGICSWPSGSQATNPCPALLYQVHSILPSILNVLGALLLEVVLLWRLCTLTGFLSHFVLTGCDVVWNVVLW